MDMEAGVEHFGRGVETSIEGGILDKGRAAEEIKDAFNLLLSKMTKPR